MENRILIVGDELFGGEGEAAFRGAEMLLCREPNRPMQFSINAPILLSLPQLKTRVASDLIGKKAGRFIVGLGLRELKLEHGDVPKVCSSYTIIIGDLISKTNSPVHLLTIPEDCVPQDKPAIGELNDYIRGLKDRWPQRVSIFDFAAHCENFKEKQAERGKFARSLYSEDGNPTSLCITLLSMFLEDCILNEVKKPLKLG